MLWRSLIAAILVGSSCIWIVAQQRTNGANVDAQRAAMRRQAQTQQSHQAEQGVYDQLRQGVKSSSSSPGTAPLDNATIERIKQFRQVDPQVAASYSAFLKSQNTGITRFFINNGCQAAGVINASDSCHGFIPQSYVFSFRTKSYANEPYGDITLYSSGIFAGGFFAQSAIISLGDKAIESIELGDPAIKLLSDIPREKDFDTAKETAVRLKKGYASSGVTVSTVAKPAANTTYAVRVIAYKSGTFVRPLSATSTTMEKWFLSLDNDTRGDILAVFRIVDIKPDGALTVLWKVLERKDAPKLKFGPDQPLADFRQ